MNKTEAALRKANWLAGCLEFGWSKSDLNGLSAAWDHFRDENGNDRDTLRHNKPDFWDELHEHLSSVYGESGTTNPELEAEKQVNEWKSKHIVISK